MWPAAGAPAHLDGAQSHVQQQMFKTIMCALQVGAMDGRRSLTGDQPPVPQAGRSHRGSSHSSGPAAEVRQRLIRRLVTSLPYQSIGHIAFGAGHLLAGSNLARQVCCCRLVDCTGQRYR